MPIISPQVAAAYQDFLAHNPDRKPQTNEERAALIQEISQRVPLPSTQTQQAIKEFSVRSEPRVFVQYSEPASLPNIDDRPLFPKLVWGNYGDSPAARAQKELEYDPSLYPPTRMMADLENTKAYADKFGNSPSVQRKLDQLQTGIDNYYVKQKQSFIDKGMAGLGRSPNTYMSMATYYDIGPFNTPKLQLQGTKFNPDYYESINDVMTQANLQPVVERLGNNATHGLGYRPLLVSEQTKLNDVFRQELDQAITPNHHSQLQELGYLKYQDPSGETKIFRTSRPGPADALSAAPQHSFINAMSAQMQKGAPIPDSLEPAIAMKLGRTEGREMDLFQGSEPRVSVASQVLNQRIAEEAEKMENLTRNQLRQYGVQSVELLPEAAQNEILDQGVAGRMEKQRLIGKLLEPATNSDAAIAAQTIRDLDQQATRFHQANLDQQRLAMGRDFTPRKVLSPEGEVQFDLRNDPRVVALREKAIAKQQEIDAASELMAIRQQRQAERLAPARVAQSPIPRQQVVVERPANDQFARLYAEKINTPDVGEIFERAGLGLNLKPSGHLIPGGRKPMAIRFR